MRYVQCELRKGAYVDHSWVEEKFAVVGKKVRVKQMDETWSDGWVIAKTYGFVTEEQAKTMKDLYKHHRKGTDV